MVLLDIFCSVKFEVGTSMPLIIEVAPNMLYWNWPVILPYYVHYGSSRGLILSEL